MKTGTVNVAGLVAALACAPAMLGCASAGDAGRDAGAEARYVGTWRATPESIDEALDAVARRAFVAAGTNAQTLRGVPEDEARAAAERLYEEWHAPDEEGISETARRRYPILVLEPGGTFVVRRADEAERLAYGTWRVLGDGSVTLIAEKQGLGAPDRAVPEARFTPVADAFLIGRGEGWMYPDLGVVGHYRFERGRRD